MGGSMKLAQILKSFRNDNSGSTAIEYGLIASLIVIASIGAFESVANENTGLWGTVKTKVAGVMGN